MMYKEIIEEVFAVIAAGENKGQLAAYIPELTRVHPDCFGVHLTTADRQGFGMGDYRHKFSIQSIAKVFALSLAYRLLNESIWERLGVEPSGTSFNSLVQLETDRGIPRNPFINAGALVICDMLLTQLKNPKEDFLVFLRDVANNNALDYSPVIAESEKSVGFRNVALCHFIKSFGNIHNSPDDVLDFYFSLCSLEMNCEELSDAFLYLVNGGCKRSGEAVLTLSQAKRINALMQTCGFYDESGEFAFKVGLPGKSGVGGGIVAVHPHQYAITVWSPRLNDKGNSYRGMKFLEMFTTRTALSIF